MSRSHQEKRKENIEKDTNLLSITIEYDISFWEVTKSVAEGKYDSTLLRNGQMLLL